jgi:hypothetical protein
VNDAAGEGFDDVAVVLFALREVNHALGDALGDDRFHVGLAVELGGNARSFSGLRRSIASR